MPLRVRLSDMLDLNVSGETGSRSGSEARDVGECLVVVCRDLGGGENRVALS